MSEQTDSETPFMPVGPANMLKPGETAIIDIGEDSFVLVPREAPRLAYRYLFDRSSFYQANASDSP